jgi:hypothetical protein
MNTESLQDLIPRHTQHAFPDRPGVPAFLAHHILEPSMFIIKLPQIHIHHADANLADIPPSRHIISLRSIPLLLNHMLKIDNLATQQRLAFSRPDKHFHIQKIGMLHT